MKTTDTPDLNLRKTIYIQNAHLHNLKHLDIYLPKNKLIVITGVSGSGKSSLAFDTLYAEGQRRYVESLSSYARQFLGKLEKPKVDDIKGLAPSIAIQQKVTSSNPRSTVGTTTEVYEYVKLLFARIGKTFSPISGKEVKKDSVSDVMDFIQRHPQKDLYLLSPLPYPDRPFNEQLKSLKLNGYTRLLVNNQAVEIEDLESFGFVPTEGVEVLLMVDRFCYEEDESFLQRLADSVQLAYYEGGGICYLQEIATGRRYTFSHLFERDGIVFTEPDVHFFSFNNPLGACPECEGYSMVIGIDPDLVIPDKRLSVYEDAVACWRGESMREWKMRFIKENKDFPVHKAYIDLSEEEKNLLWEANGKAAASCIWNFFRHLEERTYKMHYRILLARFRGKTTCPVCKGLRLRPETEHVRVDGLRIQDWIQMPLDRLLTKVRHLDLSEYDRDIAKRLLYEIESRLDFLCQVGLGYLNLNRTSASLSGGESQRIHLATSLGSSLVGSVYVLDEPSIGLHSRDTENLIQVLYRLRDLGNTVVVVEHDEDVMRAADYILDIGPGAGSGGGQVVFEGDYAGMIQSNTLTAGYLSGKLEIPVPTQRRTARNYIELRGAREHNLQNLNLDIPLESLVVVTGVSGSGKSTLVRNVLSEQLNIELGNGGKRPNLDSLTYPKRLIKHLETVDQNPIGKSSRSNPVTYVKAYDDIRDLFAKQKASKLRGYKPKHFSFNVDGGRCNTCKGEGVILVPMQFMADIELVCEECGGTRFQKEILEIHYNGKNIHQILEMTIDQAIDFFRENQETKILEKILPLQEVGLGYLQLGQSSSTLSGGEAQRVKLASYLVKGNTTEKTLFIFDEPSTGLHFNDINKLMISLQALIKQGHSVIVIEHHPDIIKCADHIIDIGPEAGDAGGQIVFEGTPEDLVKSKKGHTARYLAEKL